MPLCTGWRNHGFTFMLMLIPYSILTHFVDCRCRASGFNIVSLTSEVSRYTDWSAYPTITPYLLLHIFSVKNSEAYNLTLGSSCFLSIPSHPISYSISFDPPCDIKNNYGQYNNNNNNNNLFLRSRSSQHTKLVYDTPLFMGQGTPLRLAI
jgi:hypothetical protein